MASLPGTRLFQGDAFFGEWVGRGGDNVITRVECIDKDGAAGAKVTVTFYTKNTDDAGDPANAIASEQVVVQAKGDLKTNLIESTTTTGLKQLVRCKYVMSGGSKGEWLLIRQFSHVFFDTADGSATP
jgi:hypothetical protein